MKAPVVDPSWSDEVRRVYEHDAREIWDPSIAPQVYLQYQSQLRLYRSLVGTPPRRVLDVGCAQGTLALLLAESGHEVTAIDVRQPFLDYAASRWERGRVRFLCGDALEMEQPGLFDVVFCNQLVEHLVDPERLVRRLGEWTVPGGILVITTPNGRYVRNGLPSLTALGDRSRWASFANSADGDGHFFAFRPGELAALFPREVFERVDVSTFETPWISGHMKVRHVQGALGASLCARLDSWTRRIPVLGSILSHQLMATARRAR